MKKLKKVWRRHEKKNEEWEIKELCIYVCKSKSLNSFNASLTLLTLLYRRDSMIFFFLLAPRMKNFFLCWIFLFLKFLHSRHGTALLSMMMMTFVHMYSSHWGTSVSKHMEEFLFSRAIMKKKKNFYIWELYKVRRCRSIIFLVKDSTFSFYFTYGW